MSPVSESVFELWRLCEKVKLILLCLLSHYHRKRPPIKSKKSPVGSWRSFFNLGKSSSMSKRKLHRNPSEPNELKAMALAGESYLLN